jgi:predicted metal-dependent hydrolase
MHAIPFQAGPGNTSTEVASLAFIRLGASAVPIVYRRHLKARRYILRFERDRGVIATIPRGGSQREAFAFVKRSQAWLERQLAKNSAPMTEVWFRGEKAPLAQFGTPHVSRYLRAIAKVELIPRTFELARRTGSEISRVSVRNQRTRWGSCSARRAINLNWRLIQTPPHVVDYIILHELMHLREMNHSAKFWREVESVCPEWRVAEAWLKAHGREIMQGI